MTTRLQPVVLYRRLGSEATKRLTQGVLLLLPLMITFWLVQFAYETIDGLLQPLISAVSGEEKPGLSFGIVIAALFVVGVMSSSLLLKTPGYLIERGIVAIPGVGSIYSTTKKTPSRLEAGCELHRFRYCSTSGIPPAGSVGGGLLDDRH